MLAAGNFNGAFQAALGQSTADMPGMSQLQQLLTPTQLQNSGVTWNQNTMNAYYSALSQNAAAIQKNNNVLKSLGTTYNPQIGSGNGGNSQYLNGTFGKTPPTVTNGNYVPNPIANDFTPTFQNGHMGGVLGDVVNATGSTAITVGQAALIAGLAYAGGMGGGALAGGLGAGAGTLGGAVGTGIGAGAVGTAAGDVINNKPLTLGSVGKGAALGALSGGLGYAASPATSALTSAGVNPTLANGIVKGAVGAGVGALGSKVSGGSAANGALVGGLGGAAAGALGSATGSPTLGTVGGTIAGNLANKYLTSSPTPAAPAKPVTTAPPTATATGGMGMPTLPTTLGNTPSTGGTNIGSYSGYGYAPRTQLNPNVNYATYGQGPEAQFFSGETSGLPATTATSQPPATATGTMGMPSTPQQRI